MSKTTKKAPKELKAILVDPELAEALDGMEGTNWYTNISKNHVKTVTAYFRVRQPKVALVVK